MIVNLIDRNIAGAKSYDNAIESDRASNKITYVRDQFEFDGITIFTDECLNQVNIVSSRFKVAWLMEPKAVSPHAYSNLLKLIDSFDLVLTFDSDLLRRFPNKCTRIPACGIFLDSESIFGKSAKTKMCSMVYSRKTALPGHKLRHDVAKMIRQTKRPVDIFGTGTGSYLEKKSDALNDYRFSIAIENSIGDFYITEKVFDCFASRTVPIYWGSKEIGSEFDSNGILSFGSIGELEKILDSLSPELYEAKAKSIEENYQAVLKHRSVDDHVADAVSFLLNPN